MAHTQPTEEMWKQFVDSKRVPTAYHEAGHAVAMWVFLELFDSIELTFDGDPETGTWGSVKSHGVRAETQLRYFSYGDAHKRWLASKWILNYLAGPHAESLVDDEVGDEEKRSGEWFDDLMDNFDVFPQDGDDASNLMALADFIYPRNSGRQWQYLRTLARWTEELFADVRIRRALDALAAKLLESPVMDGAEAFDLMDSAWDTGKDWPIFALGPKWRRRFRLCNPRQSLLTDQGVPHATTVV